MKVWTDKDGNRLTAKEFFSRWKDGIMSISPYYQKKSQLKGLAISLIGIIIGMYVTLFYTKTYWMTIILFGAAVFSSMQFIGIYQTLKIYKQLEGGTLNEQQRIY